MALFDYLRKILAENASFWSLSFTAPTFLSESANRNGVKMQRDLKICDEKIVDERNKCKTGFWQLSGCQIFDRVDRDSLPKGRDQYR
jgi:hypothetical protein